MHWALNFFAVNASPSREGLVESRGAKNKFFSKSKVVFYLFFVFFCFVFWFIGLGPKFVAHL